MLCEATSVEWSDTLNQASTRGNGGTEGDNRYPGAYTDSRPVQEAGPAGTIPVREAPGDGLPQPAHPGTAPLCPTIAIPPYIRRGDAIIGLPTLQALLRPVHPYFRDKQANISEWQGYKHEKQDEHLFLYPRVKGDTAFATRHNPYRKYQLARSHAGRMVSKIRGVMENKQLADFRLAEVVFTMPKAISVELAERGKPGREIAWRMFKRFFSDVLPGVLGLDGRLAAETNLHTWRSEIPLEPHFHFHSLWPNYALSHSSEPVVTEDGEYMGDEEYDSFQKWFGQGITKRYRGDNGKWRIGCVPFSDDELAAVKRAWTKVLRDCCRRNSIKCGYLADKDAWADIYVGFVKWDDGKGRVKFIHKVNYQRRSWIEDYARFSNDNPGCANPPQWLEDYQNRSRPLGWWCRLTELCGKAVTDGKERISPFTGKPMVYWGVVSRYEFARRLQADMLGLEIIKGEAVVWGLTDEQVKWLRSVCRIESDTWDYGADDEPDSG